MTHTISSTSFFERQGIAPYLLIWYLIFMEPFASIDVGTHTTRLLIAKVKNQKIMPLVKKRRITKTGFYFNGQIITEAGIDILIETLKDYA
ncbi:MAG TPA: hypothetical protein ENF30_02910, partial [Candidatus Desulfofervidus auxilii]|nr:hypothetical protein [Candidatus Desulfofervidus auxilii]